MLRQIPLQTAASAFRRVTPATASRPFLANTTRLLTTESAKPTVTSSPTNVQTRTAKPEATTTQASTASAPRQLTYLVGRTPSNNVSVYNDKRSGGTRKETTIKKIQGNAQDLKKDLINEMKFKKEDVNVNPVTGHVKIKGWHLEQVRTWLEARGF
ncbi:54S ribosomal protein img2, mitochondrial [Gnomoniopsis smithogilvyi]|uniref:Large ribosomal subunit protein mL49 n=1 Tax=Gnomoniopsis smithogilvyi TaxID=1191159 RepID=A0A9W9CTA6_9PEZI|nr:54S ribosomal protein img2, mitochondrial [Gnomoniopsis smithogilvyi]